MSDLEKKQQIARENGSKSKGPITPEGKKRSSLNGITHGLASKCVVLANESQDAYDHLAAQYQQEWQPVSLTESHLLTQMVNSCWRLRRIWSIETALIDSELFPQTEDFEAAWSHHHPAMRAMDAMTVVQAESPMMLETLHRYELRYDRLYRSSMDQLLKLRRLRNAPEIAPSLPTPTPEPQPSETPEDAPPPTPAAWYTRFLAFLFSLLAVLHLHPAARKSPKSSPKTHRRSSEPTPFFHSAFYTFELPEFFSWLTSFIPTPARPKHQAPPQGE
ncbi:MAG: hypothetical protein IT167_16100 [Bryobacterales bacterium]|nr:hypothetical protein [Bryobacterales bacterium]